MVQMTLAATPMLLAVCFSASALADTESSTTSSVAAPRELAPVEEAPPEAEPTGAKPQGPRLEAGEFYFVPSLQVRPRFFALTGRDFAPGDEQVYVTNRARVGMTLGHSSGIELSLRVQDTRIWGEEQNTTDFVANGVDFHEAYATIPLFGVGILKIGRQEISLDNERLVGPLDWAQRARSFDALSLHLGVERLALDVFAAKVQEADQDPDGNVPDGRGGDVDLVGFHPTFELFGQRLALVYLFNGSYEAMSTTHTVGGSVLGLVAEHLSYQVELYVQVGERLGADVDGVLVGGTAGYQVIGWPTKPKLSLWGEYISGNFDTLYATNHKFYGEMDFFLNLPVQTLGLGLMDLGGRFELFPIQDLRVNVDFHHFRSAGEEDAMGNDTFGSELDVKLTYKLWKFVGTRMLYGVFLPGELMRTRSGLTATAELEVEHFFYWTIDVQI